MFEWNCYLRHCLWFAAHWLKLSIVLYVHPLFQLHGEALRSSDLSSQRRKSRSSIQQSSTFASWSYVQSIRKDSFREFFGLPYEQQSTLYSPKRKQETTFYRDLEHSSHRPYTEGHGQKDHRFDSTQFMKSFRQHWSWSIALQDLRYGCVIGFTKVVQELFVRPPSRSSYWIYTVWRANNHPWGTSRYHFITFSLLHLVERPT